MGILALEIKYRFPVSANIDMKRQFHIFELAALAGASVCKVHAHLLTEVWKQISPLIQKLSHSTKQIGTMLLFPVPSGPLDTRSAQEEALW